MSVALALLAMLIEAVVGYPDRLVRAIGHPVIGIGKLISALERRLNRAHPSYAGATGEFSSFPAPSPTLPRKRGRERVEATREGGAGEAGREGGAGEAGREGGAGEAGSEANDNTEVRHGAEGAADKDRAASRIPGIIALLILLAVVGGVSLAAERALLLMPFGVIPLALAASSLIAQRSLHEHVVRVATALETEGLEAGRDAVSRIVGRDPKSLDDAGVARAAIESLAENFSDGVVAPVFWLALTGLPGAAIYKAVNTADSMIGHRTPRYDDFGWAAARLDDLLNLPASRLSALLLVAAAAMTSREAATRAWSAVRRDASRHRSPNAGFPEAAMAGALSLKLAGPRVYSGVTVEDAFMGDGRRDATAADIRAALALYRRADALLIALLAIVAAAFTALA